MDTQKTPFEQLDAAASSKGVDLRHAVRRAGFSHMMYYGLKRGGDIMLGNFYKIERAIDDLAEEKLKAG